MAKSSGTKRLKNKSRKLEQDVRVLNRNLRRVYDFFNGAMQGLSSSIAAGMERQEALAELGQFSDEQIKTVIEANRAKRKAEAEAKQVADMAARADQVSDAIGQVAEQVASCDAKPDMIIQDGQVVYNAEKADEIDATLPA